MKKLVFNYLILAPLGFVLILTSSAQALEVGDLDAFFLGFGTSNIEVKDNTELLDGQHVGGGLRLGIFSWLFIEGGYGAISYSGSFQDSTSDSSPEVEKELSFRTTGPNLGLGFVFSVRNFVLGAKISKSINNKWIEEVSIDGSKETNTSGDINFDSYFIFAQFLEQSFEVGIRRDAIEENDSLLENSFGVYLQLNI